MHNRIFPESNNDKPIILPTGSGKTVHLKHHLQKYCQKQKNWKPNTDSTDYLIKVVAMVGVLPIIRPYNQQDFWKYYFASCQQMRPVMPSAYPFDRN